MTAAKQLKDAFSFEVMTNLDSILKSRDNTLLTKVHLVKAMVFPVVMYGCAKEKKVKFQLCLTLCKPWTVAYQVPPSMGFFRQEYWNELLPFPSPGDLPDPGIEPGSPTLQAVSLLTESSGKPSSFLV